VQEREAQISYKQTMKQLRTKADQALLEQQRAALARAEEEEKKKAEERKKKLLEQKTIQGTQVGDPLV
jgi:ribosomal protein L9